jgi:hypothetical protein
LTQRLMEQNDLDLERQAIGTSEEKKRVETEE